MKLEEISTQPCSIARALSEVGDGWSLMIIRDAFYGRTRFSDFVKYSGAQKTIVSDRLKRLVASGILLRVEYEEHPKRCDYQLTAKGADLAHLMLALSAWGDRWLEREDRASVRIKHNDCNNDAEPTVTCSHCGGELHAANLRAEPGTSKSASTN